MTAVARAAQEAREAFKALGAVCVRQVFEPKWVSLVARGIAKNLEQPSQHSENLGEGLGKGKYFNDYMNWRKIPEFKDFMYNSPAAQLAGHVMGSKTAILYHDHVLVKGPHCDKKTPWHHDQSYYPVDGIQNCSLWMPVDKVGKENCIRFVGGSHNWGKWFYPRKFATGKDYPQDNKWKPDREFEPVPDIEAELDKYEILNWDLEPGDCIIFHMRTLHAAPGNSSENPRRILSTRFLGDDAVKARRPWTVSPPVLGGGRSGQSIASDIFPVVWSQP